MSEPRDPDSGAARVRVRVAVAEAWRAFTRGLGPLLLGSLVLAAMSWLAAYLARQHPLPYLPGRYSLVAIPAAAALAVGSPLVLGLSAVCLRGLRGTPVWNDYLAENDGPYCLLYLDETSVTTAKWMEAIREGTEDFEYLVMLRDQVAKLEAAGRTGPGLGAAKALLTEGPQRVLAGEKGANYEWNQPKDRGVADRVRYEVLDALEKLGQAR